MLRDHYQKLCDGDKLSNRELMELLKALTKAQQAMVAVASIPEYRLVYSDMCHRLSALEGFAKARGLLDPPKCDSKYKLPDNVEQIDFGRSFITGVLSCK